MQQEIKVSKTKITMKIFFVLLIYRSLMTERQGIFHVTYWDKYVFGIICCVMLFVALIAQNYEKYVISRTVTRIMCWLITPITIAWLYSCVLMIVQTDKFSGILTRSFSNVAFTMLAVIQGVLVYLYFREEAVNLTFIAYVCCFMTSVVIALMNGGLYQFGAMLFDSTFNGSVLEMSELTPAICLFIIYYLYKYQYRGMSKKETIIRTGICVFILLIGMKRILILSLMCIAVLYSFLKWKRGRLNLWIDIITIGLILVIYLYIFGISSGILFDLFQKFNINTMARLQIWKAIDQTYDFSLFYFGKGLGYATKWMDNNWSTIGIIGLTQTTGLHNDLLKYYIDLGFWGIGIYIFVNLNIIAKKIGKMLDKKAELVYFLLVVLQILCWFTDNVSAFHVFMWPFYLIVFSLISDVRGISKEDKI